MKLSAQPCVATDNQTYNLIKKCFLYGKEINCESLFKPVITDIGICCAANTRYRQ